MGFRNRQTYEDPRILESRRTSAEGLARNQTGIPLLVLSLLVLVFVSISVATGGGSTKNPGD